MQTTQGSAQADTEGLAAELAHTAARLAEYGSATVVDACEHAAMLDADWIPLLPHCAIAGPVLTVRCIAGDNLSIHAAIEHLRPGHVLAITGGEHSSIALLGDMLGTQARAHGAAGVLLDGPVRDVQALRALGLPVWARSIRPRGPAKNAYGAVGQDITVAGTNIRNGDWLVMDADGVVLVPADALAGALDGAHKRHQNESSKRSRYAAGELSVDVLGLRPAIAAQRLANEDSKP